SGPSRQLGFLFLVEFATLAVNRKMPTPATLSAQFKGLAGGVFRLRAKFLLNPKQLVVFGGAIGSGKRSGFYLPTAGGHRKVGDSGVFGFAGAMRHHGCVACLVRHFDGS